MCSQIRCGRCGKPTWTGCGRHIEAALANVPVGERCTCREQKREAGGQEGAPKRKWRLFGR